MKRIFTLFIFLFIFSTLFAQTLYTRKDTIAITQDSVTLQAGKFRGVIQWQYSTDKKMWNNLNGKIEETLKVIKSAEGYYRAEIIDHNCIPVYSDTAQIALPKLDVITLKATNINKTTAVLNGSLILLNSAHVLNRGFYLSSQNTTPNEKDSVLISLDDNSLFHVGLEKLKMKTKYYYTAFASCETGIYIGEPISFETDSSNIIVMVNPTDPMLLSANADNKYSIDIYGKKDTLGIPKAINQVVVKDSLKQSTTIFLDNQKRPYKIIASNGVIFELAWLTNDRIALKILASDGITQLNSEINLSKEPLSDKTILSNKSVMVPQQEFKSIYTYPKYKSSCMLYVDKCGVGQDAEAWIEVQKTTGEFIRRIVPEKLDDGVYAGMIPSDLAPTLDVSKICSSLVDLLDGTCVVGSDLSLSSMLCVSVSSAIAMTAIGATVAPELLAACESASIALYVYCHTLGFSLGDGGKGFLYLLISSYFSNLKIESNVKIVGVVNGLPYNFYSQPVIVSGEGPFPDLHVDLGSEHQIESLTTTPAAALVSNSYTAVAKTSCLKIGTTIKISVSGDDGYKDQNSYSVTGNTTESEIKLEIPATKKGVVDVCTVLVTLPDGSILKKNEVFQHVVNAEDRMKNYHIVVVQGDNQKGSPGLKLPLPIIVQVLDKDNKPVKGAKVFFESEFYPGKYLTIDSRDDGKVAVEWTLDSIEGIQKVNVFLADDSGKKIEKSALVITAECKIDAPTITTNAVSNITETTATCGGNITDDGGAEITARGVCWNTTGAPSIANNKNSNGAGIGAFTSGLSSLAEGTTYYVRAYATNSKGTAYGNEVSFTTPSAITITTANVSNITANSATCGGTITSNKTITARGVCWNTFGSPTISDNKTNDGNGTGSFTSSLTGLPANASYYVRAYVTTSEGTKYGNQVSFKTSEVQISLPTVTTSTVTNITETTATSGGNVTNDGGATATTRGVCWNTSGNPTITDSRTTDGNGTGSFTSLLSGLTANTTYYLRAYATNSKGTSYGEQISFKTKYIDFILGTMTDVRDGKTYRTITLGAQTWLAQNLAYLPYTTTAGVWSVSLPCYYKYGFYNWPAASTACPSGWHLPYDAEWTILSNYLGRESEAGDNSIVRYFCSDLPGWYNGGNYSEGNGKNITWWGIPDNSGSLVLWSKPLYWYQPGVYRGTLGVDEGHNGLGVRCVKD